MRIKSALLKLNFIVLFSISSFSPALANVLPRVGDLFTKFTVRTLDEKSFSIEALKGKMVIIHLWATWCPACKNEMPILDHFYRAHHQDGVELIALSVDRTRERKSVLQFMHDFSFPAAFLNEAKNSDFASPGVLPVTYVIDPKGTLYKIYQAGSETLTENSLLAVLKELTVVPNHQ